ncbi:cell division protein FtsQ/DivIB [Candidatus Pelagibacter sp.]|uniref:cell division protein FtsQ/DivIB n=1 Tax=Candidatus Pelagibacter sp. TaxID=2024849 RepID=UPI003F87A223
MHQRKSKKILIYFFLLIILSSVSNLNLYNSSFDNIKTISVIGLNENDKNKIINDLEYLKLEKIFFLKKDKIIKIIQRYSIIEKFKIFKKYPSSLIINIEKAKLLAKMQYQNKIYYIGSNGKLSKDNYTQEELPYIFGAPDVIEFLNFQKTLVQSKIDYNHIKSLFFFKSKRWDIKLKNNITVKLPKKVDKLTLNNLWTILNDNRFENIKIIDLRINNQIILDG